MPNMSIKDVPDAIAEALRMRAARNHRSLQGELMAIIEQAVQDTSVAGGGSQDPAGTSMRAGVQRGWKSIEQIHAEHLVKFPEPIQGGPLSVDIIREDRDSR